MELIIQDFIDYLESKQVSKNTLLSYKRDINQLNAYLAQIGKKMFEATEEDLTAYIAYMQTLEKSHTSCFLAQLLKCCSSCFQSFAEQQLRFLQFNFCGLT